MSGIRNLWVEVKGWQLQVFLFKMIRVLKDSSESNVASDRLIVYSGAGKTWTDHGTPIIGRAQCQIDHFSFTLGITCQMHKFRSLGGWLCWFHLLAFFLYFNYLDFSLSLLQWVPESMKYGRSNQHFKGPLILTKFAWSWGIANLSIFRCYTINS